MNSSVAEFLAKGGGLTKSFQYCVDASSADTILYFRAIQGDSGGNQINPALQDNVLLPSDFAEHIYHVVESHDTHSVIQPSLIPGGKNVKERKRCGVLCGRELNVHRSLSRGITK